jgi:transposase, IS5 family
MKQQTFAMAADQTFENYRKPTRRDEFLKTMEAIVPWSALCEVIEPHYPKSGNGRPPIGLERMPRIHFIQHWFNLADLACEEALYDSASLRSFVHNPHKVNTGTIVDATIIGAPSSTKNADKARDPDMHQTRVTAANMHDKHPLPDLLHGNEQRVYRDSAYASQKDLIASKAPKAKDFTNQRTRYAGVVDEAVRAKNRSKSKVRARVEHVFGVPTP